MSEGLQRPPRPDEEAELLRRFHNGDTLDNLPVIKPLAPPPRRAPVGRLIAAVLGMGLLTGVGGALIAQQVLDDGTTAAAPAPDAKASASPPDGSEAATPSPESASEPAPAPEPEPETTVQAAAVEQVRIIRTPSTGGDVAATFCLVYTGSTSGPEREAILLLNAPAYQCADLLPYDPESGPFMTEAPDCPEPSRAAVLSFAESTEWGANLMYTCLTEHNGA
ncbi:hypothetical protein [Streptomyces sp. UH6]|uniref:hypothetical protein n=1 Tax=Streptomyces sp. UH6 TaxID=2748379 RepID=UPI0015D4938E|nr:hypothetical protein [Streptomyces sp. UH6]NYV73449.1 hypothetical protein [Streptomyces sp. UH6]